MTRAMTETRMPHRFVRPLCRAAAALAGVALLGAGVARPGGAQIAGVLARPRAARPARDSAAGPDSTVRVGRTSAKIPAQERQRLDIQAWVDSAAGALAQAPPAPIPAPGAGSIFNAPAVPDSLRPPPAPAPQRGRARRSTRARAS
ncbi:hypothetical protein tb265_07870 [Gemmatimonadetes bacterium T265]|nr:hypothetical protein tb265_07870 [Gemmatimonadetes bacterium T265]